MRVLHVITSLSRQGGGPARSSQGLVAGLCAAGVEAWLMTLWVSEKPWIPGVDHFYEGTDFPKAVHMIRPDLVHLHGIWSPALHRCAVLCRKLNIPYVIAPRGMLEPWSLRQKWLKKKMALMLYQGRDLSHAAALHATAESEAEQFRRLGYCVPCIISPNGVNLPLSQINREDERSQRRVLFVSRMHPKKGVLELVESWARVRPQGWQCELVYTKLDPCEQEYENVVKARVRDLGLSDAFIFTGPLKDEVKWEAYGRADLFVLPTYSENFGIVVVEALWAGVPVITTKGTPWAELETRHCGRWIALPKKDNLKGSWLELDGALRELTSMSDACLSKMGEAGHLLVEERYTWTAVVQSMVRGYEEILTRLKKGDA